jgi:hypothetical protein
MSKNFLEKLRNRSDAEKRIIAFNASFLITAFIFTIWIVSTFYSNSSSVSENVASDVNNMKQAAQASVSMSPFESVKETFSDIFKGGKEIYEIEN